MVFYKAGDKVKLNKFTMIPVELLEAMGNKKLKGNDVVIYSLLLNRLNLSLENTDRFSDNEGNVYVVFEQQELSELTSISNRSILTCVERLSEAGFLEVKRDKFTKANMYFLKQLDSIQNGVPENIACTYPKNLRPSNTDSINNYINNTQDTINTEITDKKTKTYTTLSSGGFFLKHYGEQFKRYFKTDHKEISQDDLITLSTMIDDITHELNIDRVLYTTLVDYHFKHLSTKNNGHIKAFIGRKNDSPLYRYINNI